MITKSQARAFVDAIVKLRELATDEQAAVIPTLYPVWKNDMEYAAGDRVLYQDVLYKVVQDHVSKEEQTPDVATDLFTKVLIENEDAASEEEAE